MKQGVRWVVQDRFGNHVYLTDERWEHITDESNHIEMLDFEEHLKRTISRGNRQQVPLNPRKYRYSLRFDDLPNGFTHILAIVLFGFRIDENVVMTVNNYVATAYMIHAPTSGS